MEIEDLHETFPSDPLGFVDEEPSYTFDFNSDFNTSLDPYPVKHETPVSGEETLFDSPSSSPHPVVPEDPFSMPFGDLSSHTSEGDINFDDPIAVDPQEPAFDPPLADFSLSQPDASSYVESRDSDSEGQANKRGRKRKAAATPAQSEKRARKRLGRFEPGSVIPKEDLLNMTSDELEEYAQHIQESNLSNAEKNEIRKQLRLVKNRESAQASRLRKKNYVDDLERRVTLLQSENTNLRQNVNNLHNENTQLKSEVVYLKGVVNNSGLSKVLTQGASFFNKLSQQQQQPSTPGAKTAPLLNTRTTGVVLMVMLFSFGLLFNSQGLQPQGPLPGKTMVQDTTHSRVLNHANFKPTSEVRDVLSVLDQSEMPTQRIRQIVEKQRAMPDSASHKVVDERVPLSKQVTQPLVQSPTPKVEEMVAIPDWKANTTYLLCPEVKKLTPPPEVTTTDPSLPMQISFLIPSDALGAGDDSSGAGPSRSRGLLEVTCQVVDVTSRADPVGLA